MPATTGYTACSVKVVLVSTSAVFHLLFLKLSNLLICLRYHEKGLFAALLFVLVGRGATVAEW